MLPLLVRALAQGQTAPGGAVPRPAVAKCEGPTCNHSRTVGKISPSGLHTALSNSPVSTCAGVPRQEWGGCIGNNYYYSLHVHIVYAYWVPPQSVWTFCAYRVSLRQKSPLPHLYYWDTHNYIVIWHHDPLSWRASYQHWWPTSIPSWWPPQSKLGCSLVGLQRGCSVWSGPVQGVPLVCTHQCLTSVGTVKETMTHSHIIIVLTDDCFTNWGVGTWSPPHLNATGIIYIYYTYIIYTLYIYIEYIYIYIII